MIHCYMDTHSFNMDHGFNAIDANKFQLRLQAKFGIHFKSGRTRGDDLTRPT